MPILPAKIIWSRPAFAGRDEFSQTAILSTSNGEQRTQSRIDPVYGAGAGTDEVYLTWHGERLYELPIAWLHPQQTVSAADVGRQRVLALRRGRFR